MPVVEALPVGPDTTRWAVWGTTAHLVVTDPAQLPTAGRLARRYLAEVDEACSRLRGDSEIHRVQRAAGRTVRVSGLLAEFVAVALHAAEVTDGDVDPTVGAAMVRLDHHRDLSRLPTCGGWRVPERPTPGWRRVHLDGRALTVPVGVLLDLGATAKAHAVDRCARAVATECGTGVLIGLGGDIATAGPAPEGGWRVRVPGDPAGTVTLPAGAALATSGTTGRSHRILDPRTGRPAPETWRTVSVTGDTSVQASTLTTAAMVRGVDAHPWLAGLGAPARLVSVDGQVITLGGWPAVAQPVHRNPPRTAQAAPR
ncbi:FAD:protein FMN transferase [Planosporangium mesophilum]|uniref:FAD:protein FMN transferase n=1 Tax=Planosporangium mesophilum TaxID=689768 RepID=A0A8J3TB41_9ACTN|nr:FAD:protein FMN transferase [Planosporangium mesophilum]NJC84491.1 FAD:protein FMN transferase [Planosporangium mesophilum]GII23363.1 FAD:protein FMN transferase [Planosporangium mesophilum]